MKVVMLTRGHLPRINPQAVEFATDIVCHDDVTRKTLARHYGFDIKHIHVHHCPEQLGMGKCGWIRDWIQDNLTFAGEWYANIDDNAGFARLPEPYYSMESIDWNKYDDVAIGGPNFRELYRTPMTHPQFLDLLEEVKRKCEEQKTIHGGVSGEENFYFRSKKWSIASYVHGKLMITRNVGLKWVWHPDLVILTDFARTCKVIAEYGSVALNRFAQTTYRYYQEGGIGTKEERQPAFRRMAKFLHSEFAGLVDYYRGDETVLHIKIHHPKSLAKWREKWLFERSDHTV